MKNIFQHHVTKDEAKEGRDLTNKMWSPLSMYMAISILYMGTAGNTRKQLGKNKSVLLRGGDKLIISKFLNIVLIRDGFKKKKIMEFSIKLAGWVPYPIT